jgi:hypothetical protein
MLFSLLYFLVRRLLGAGSRLQEGVHLPLKHLHLVSAVSTDSCWRRRAGPVVFLRRQTRDPAPMAPGARAQEVDIQEESAPRPAADRPRSPGPHPPPR